MFIKIIDHVESGKLLFFWNNNYNMFSLLTKEQLNSIKERMSGTRRKLILNPDTIADIICMCIEF